MAAGGFLQSTKGGFVSTSGGGGSALSLAEEGSELTASTVSIDVVGAALTASTSGDAVTITQGTWGASSVIGPATMTLGSDADGDTYYRTSNVLTRLAKGGAGEVLTMNSGATAPEWATAGGGQTTGNTNLTSASNITADLSAGNIFHLTAAHNFALAFSNATLGNQWYFIITQDGTGGRTATWPATFHFAGGANPALSTSAAAKDVVHVICANASGGSEEFICSIGYGLG
jgi:hypothetical protein